MTRPPKPSARAFATAVAAVALLLVVVVGALALLRVGESPTLSVTVDQTLPPGHFAAQAVMSQPRTAPQFTLRDSLGHMVSLSRFKGRAVILTFIYSQCPDVCPLIVAKLHAARLQLGPLSSRVEMIGVSVDPRGDTPASVNAFLARERMAGHMEYLIGTRRQLAPIWQEYAVAVRSNPVTTEIGHSAVLYGITASGTRLTVYSATNFEPQMIVHDVPLLAAR